MALTNLNKLFVRVTDASLRNAVITKSGTDNKIYFLTTTHEIITHGVVYGISSNAQDEITKIKSILNTYYTSGTEDSVKTAIDAVQTALNDYKTKNDAKRAVLIKAVAYNAAEKTIDFTQENNEVQHINVSDIIGNHIVKSSAYDASTNKLTITFSAGDKANTDVPVDIDLGKLLDMNDVISSSETYFTVSYAEKKLTITPVTKKVNSGEEGIADAKDVKTYVDAAVRSAQGALQAAITKEVSDRNAADQALYGAVIPADGASTISGNAANIAALTATINEIKDALANSSTFWEDYTPEAQP